MAARMEVQQRKSKLFAALQFVEERLAGFLQRFSDRMAEINQIAVVRQNLVALVTVFFTGGFEFFDDVFRQRCGFPLTLVLGEKRKSRGFQLVRPQYGLIHAACRTDMCSDKLHFCSSVIHRVNRWMIAPPRRRRSTEV